MNVRSCRRQFLGEIRLVLLRTIHAALRLSVPLIPRPRGPASGGGGAELRVILPGGRAAPFPCAMMRARGLEPGHVPPTTSSPARPPRAALAANHCPGGRRRRRSQALRGDDDRGYTGGEEGRSRRRHGGLRSGGGGEAERS